MPTYKGNAGHLMQHWTLCELVDIADEQYVPGLNFIDAHAMAPCAEEPDDNPGYSGPRFLNARAVLPGQQSVYERAWHQLAPNDGYPNSANFVQRIWTRDFSMLLCEKNPATVTALDEWLPSVQCQPRCKRAKVIPGDWRDRFARGLPSPADVGLPEGSLTFVSFDPDMYSLANVQDNPRKLYPNDVRQKLLPAMTNVPGPVIIQLSTYDSARGQSPQDAVIASVHSILMDARFTRAAKIRLDGNMMSLVYARDISWWAELANLPRRFDQWCPR